MSDLQTITETLITGDAVKLEKLVRQAIDDGISANDILQKGLISAMDIVGARMESGEMFIPEVLMSGRAMGISVEVLKPLLTEGQASSAGKVIIGTVKGDLHDIGKNLVVMMIESVGFEVIDLGVDVEPEIFVDAIRKHRPDIVGLSALLTTTMPMMKKTIESIKEAGLKDSLKIIVGGAPVNKAFAEEIGADAYAADAGSASKMAKEMCA
jgi:5-methyltetrahydrofolate--homocysteine methyltransferase